MSKWTDAELQIVRDWYAEHDGKPLELDVLAACVGRLKSNVSRKARSMGLTNHKRTRVEKINGYYPSAAPKFFDPEERRRHNSISRKEWHKTHDHPRGALGMKHKPEIAESSRKRMNAMHQSSTPDDYRERGRRSTMTRINKYGTAGPVNVKNPYSRGRGGKRDDLDGLYVRSSWEANYARYLNWLQARGEIRGWEYEPDVFLFEGYTRGARAYTPDFKVTEKNGEVIYHEVKGWMDGPSKTRLKRMAKHYPHIKVIVIGEAEYKAIKKWRGMIPDWE